MSEGRATKGVSDGLSQQSQIQSELIRSKNCINNLHETVKMLADKLSPVLRDEIPKPEINQKEIVGEMLVPLANEMATANNEIELCDRYICSLLDRTEL